MCLIIYFIFYTSIYISDKVDIYGSLIIIVGIHGGHFDNHLEV